MITSLFIVCIIYAIIKHYNLELNSKKIILTFLITISIPLIYLQVLILSDNLYTINVASDLESIPLNLQIKNGYIGEKLEDKYIIYQENEDLVIPLNDLIINKNQENDLFEKVILISNYEIEFNNSLNELLCKDFFMDKPIVNKNKELKNQTDKIYILNLKNNLKIKGDV